ncbi:MULTISPECIES: aminotransferase class V-fold PLP-dependent enzyme [unclassified Leifsonia]|uniref:aminotransferase class V-fold PLP-dependent enzyme n=1 Tax=unclassified Leifsonia TaxID=2663824 RepID=UPI0006FDA051|nr:MULTISPECIES: aminotransferase class V-fold PLP-dependent enzyme [unclassified Leifsonia]KQX07281.1 class V aminotransferase [Leifsonia sp. Root1293]KRA11564.1 class V aminotransferase [Leifsonia sp. Root60]
MTDVTTRLTVTDARQQFAAGRGYLAACTLGLPALETTRAMRADAERWARGEASAVDYTAIVERTRASYAGLVGVAVDRVAIGSQTSAMAAVIAASVPDGAEVLCVDGDFSSIVFPFLSQTHRGVTVRSVPLAELAASVTTSTWLVAFSLVQSATGAVADAAAVVAAAAVNDARTLCDMTQAVGWMPVDAALFDATICHSYKWLCAPRGAAFLTVSAAFAADIAPTQTGWYAGDDPWSSCYGPTMTLAADARRFDVSPAWPVWVGAETAISLFAQLDLQEVRAHVTGLAAAFTDGLGLERRPGQAIVTWPDAEGLDLARLTASGITASGRAGCARVAFHLWNDEQDVADALAALGR